MSRELLQQCLDLITELDKDGMVLEAELIFALRDELAKPEQEPVAWISDSPTKGNGKQLHFTKADAWKWSSNITPLYTAPPRKEWVGLTEDDIFECQLLLGDFARAIEARLKELNT